MARLRRLLLFGGLMVLVASPGGCSGYDDVSPTTYEFAKALYSITNRKAEDRLPSFKAKLQEAVDSGEVPQREAEWLTDIVAEAEQGDWQAASRECRRMMEDQVDYST